MPRRDSDTAVYIQLWTTRSQARGGWSSPPTKTMYNKTKQIYNDINQTFRSYTATEVGISV